MHMYVISYYIITYMSCVHVMLYCAVVYHIAPINDYLNGWHKTQHICYCISCRLFVFFSFSKRSTKQYVILYAIALFRRSFVYPHRCTLPSQHS